MHLLIIIFDIYLFMPKQAEAIRSYLCLRPILLNIFFALKLEFVISGKQANFTAVEIRMGYHQVQIFLDLHHLDMPYHFLLLV